MKTIDLKKNQRFIKQYVFLRNQYTRELLTLAVDIEDTKQWLNRPDVEIIGLIEGSALLGVVILYLNRKGEIAFFVKDKNNGIGTRLLNIIAEIAGKHGLEYIWGWTRIDNKIALRVFEKNGFRREKISVRKHKGSSLRGIKCIKYLNKINVLIFGMTGFGNNVFNVIDKTPNFNIVGLFTPAAYGFPYYKCIPIKECASRKGIPVFEGLSVREKKTVALVRSLSPDLIIVATFPQIIPSDIICIPRLGVINIHPSLLPKYRSATPTFWALANGEKETGITVHFIEDEKVDAGRIIAQLKLKIEDSDTDGLIRYKLGKLLKNALLQALRLIPNMDNDVFPEQDERIATFYTKRTLKDVQIDCNWPLVKIMNRIRAASPYPGARLNCGGREYIVDNAILTKANKLNSVCVNDKTKNILCNTACGVLKFHIAEQDKYEQ